MSLKELLSYISVTTLLLMFLFFCGTLYIICYWTTFDFDITNYIELFDIPKSFVFPLATGLGVSLLSLLAQALVNSSSQAIVSEKTSTDIQKKPTAIGKTFKIIDANFIILAVLAGGMMLYRSNREWVIIGIGLSLSLWGFSKINKSKRIIVLMPDRRLRLFFIVLFIFIPIYSFCKGKLDGIAVWKNRNYYVIADIKYTQIGHDNKMLIGKKLLGKLGSVVIVTDSINANITVISLENVEMVQYKFTKSPGLLSE